VRGYRALIGFRDLLPGGHKKGGLVNQLASLAEPDLALAKYRSRIVAEPASQVQFKLSFCSTIPVDRWPPMLASSDFADAGKAQYGIDVIASIFKSFFKPTFLPLTGYFCICKLWNVFSQSQRLIGLQLRVIGLRTPDKRLSGLPIILKLLGTELCFQFLS